MKTEIKRIAARAEAVVVTVTQLTKNYHSVLNAKTEEQTKKIKFADIVLERLRMSELFQLTIDPKYLHLVPRPEKNQIRALKESMKESGQQVKIIVNAEGVILDGHTRYQICQDLGLEPKYQIKKFKTKQDEKEFVISANLNRRQLTMFERGELLFSWWKEEKKRSKAEGGRDRGETMRSGISQGKTAQGKKERLLPKFGRIIGCGASLAHEITWLLLHADEETKVKLRKEDITIQAAYLQLKKPDRKPRSAYGNYLRHNKCLNCGGKLTAIQDTDCHVHSQYCCQKCGWGN